MRIVACAASQRVKSYFAAKDGPIRLRKLPQSILRGLMFLIERVAQTPNVPGIDSQTLPD